MRDFTVIAKCPMCEEIHEVKVIAEDYFAWIDGELIQNAMPYLSADERELLKTGICPKCWNEMFDC